MVVVVRGSTGSMGRLRHPMAPVVVARSTETAARAACFFKKLESKPFMLHSFARLPKNEVRC